MYSIIGNEVQNVKTLHSTIETRKKFDHYRSTVKLKLVYSEMIILGSLESEGAFPRSNSLGHFSLRSRMKDECRF